MKYFFWLLLLMPGVAGAQTVYIVRHAEKATQDVTMTSDVPLSSAGIQRANDLKKVLLDKKITYIFSTDKLRTKSTAQPLSEAAGVPVEIYANDTLPKFIERVKALKANVLIVGHSNTIDDLVNALCGEKVISADYPESSYDNLLIVKLKNKKPVFIHKKYGASTE